MRAFCVRAPLPMWTARRGVVAFGIGVVLLLWLAIGWDLARERERLLRSAEEDATNLTQAFGEHIHRTITGLDQVLLYAKAAYERDPASFDLKWHASHSAVMKTVSLQLAFIGADGFLVDTTVVNSPRMDLSDREHFRVHAASDDVGLFISKPVLGRASGRWSVQLARRVNAPDGTFAGVLVVSMDPQYLAGLYNSMELGDAGAILVVGRDGVVRAGSSSGQWQLGAVLPDGGTVERLFASKVDFSRMNGPVDGTVRLMGVRAVEDLPLMVMVGRSEAEVLAPLRHAESTYLLVGLAISLVLAAAVITLYRVVLRQEEIAEALQVKKDELEANREQLRRYVTDLEQIADVAAHDLQEPLRRVVAYAQLLASHTEGRLDDESRHFVSHVVEGARRIRKLVRDLESFVAVDRLPPAQGGTSADEALAVAVRRLRDPLQEAGASVVVDRLPVVAGDHRSLVEVFVQLLDNAIRYRDPERKAIIHVTGRREVDRALFTVRDNGLGIDRHHWNRVFEVFHRLEPVDGGGGTGIGLAIVRRIVDRLGGRVWVESEVGQGSSFHFTLPLDTALTSAREAPSEAA